MGLPPEPFSYSSDSVKLLQAKKKKGGGNIFLAFTVSRSAKFSSAENKLSLFTTRKEGLSCAWSVFLPPSLPSRSFLGTD